MTPPYIPQRNVRHPGVRCVAAAADPGSFRGSYPSTLLVLWRGYGLGVPRRHRCRTNEQRFQILNNIIPVRWLRVIVVGAGVFATATARRCRPGAAQRSAHTTVTPLSSGPPMSSAGNRRTRIALFTHEIIFVLRDCLRLYMYVVVLYGGAAIIYE